MATTSHLLDSLRDSVVRDDVTVLQQTPDVLTQKELLAELIALGVTNNSRQVLSYLVENMPSDYAQGRTVELILLTCLKENQWDLFAEFLRAYDRKLEWSPLHNVLEEVLKVDFAAGEQLLDERYPQVIGRARYLLKYFAAHATLESYLGHLAQIQAGSKYDVNIEKEIKTALRYNNTPIIDYYFAQDQSKLIPKLIPHYSYPREEKAAFNRLFKEQEDGRKYNRRRAVLNSLYWENREILEYLIEKYPDLNSGSRPESDFGVVAPKLNYTEIVGEYLSNFWPPEQSAFFLANEALIPYQRQKLLNAIYSDDDLAYLTKYLQDSHDLTPNEDGEDKEEEEEEEEEQDSDEE